MPPKKQRREQPQRETVQHTFLNKEARERYRYSLVEKKCIPERGFHEPMKGLRQMIEDRNWREFTKSPTAAVIPVVREFYVNARRSTDFRVLVRGRWVVFDSKAINEVYNLPDLENDEFSVWRSDEPDCDVVIRFLAKPGTVWTTSKGVILHFPFSNLRAAGKIWHHFISEKLLPTNHRTEVTKERALINFAIQRGMSINVGKIIGGSIMNIARGLTHSGGLGHPSLIYELCVRSGVPTRSIEEIQHPKPPITQKVVRRITGREEPSESSSDEEADSSTDDQQPGPSTSRPSTSRPSTSLPRRGIVKTDVRAEQAYLKRRMDIMQQSLEQQGQAINSLHQKLDFFMEQQAQQFAYMAELHLASMHAAQQQGDDAVQFPQPPAYQSYTAVGASDEEEEEGDEDEEETESG